MGSAYVQARGGNFYVGQSRVTLDSVILLWQSGQSPEAIQRDFPSVPLAAVYGTIAYYLEHQPELDRYLRDAEGLWRTQRAADEQDNPEFYAKMRRRLAEARACSGWDELDGPAVSAAGEDIPHPPRASAR